MPRPKPLVKLYNYRRSADAALPVIHNQESGWYQWITALALELYCNHFTIEAIYLTCPIWHQWAKSIFPLPPPDNSEAVKHGFVAVMTGTQGCVRVQMTNATPFMILVDQDNDNRPVLCHLGRSGDATNRTR